MVELRSIGEQILEIDEEVVFIKWSGARTLAEDAEFRRILEEIIAKYGRVFELIDISEQPFPGAALRKAIARWHQSHPACVAIACGVRPAQLALMKLITNTLNLLNRGGPEARLFTTEAEARAFIAAQRTRRA